MFLVQNIDQSKPGDVNDPADLITRVVCHLKFTVTTPYRYKITGLFETVGSPRSLAHWRLTQPDPYTYVYCEEEWTDTSSNGTFSPDGVGTGDDVILSGSPSGIIEPGDYEFVLNYKLRNLTAGTHPASAEDAWGKFELLRPAVPVDIDIKPGSYPNAINNDGNGVIPVAILGNADFDVTLIAPEKVALEGMAVKAVGKANKFLSHYEDVNGDGFDDLVVQIEDADGVFTEGTTEAILTGELYEGTPIEGSDEITIVP